MTQYLRDLSGFTKEEMDDFLASFDTVLTDCDGVLWLHNTQLEGSVEVINRLKELGKKVFLVTNSCNSTLKQYMNITNTFGLRVAEDEMIFPSLVAASYFREQNFKKKAYILASSALKEIFESNGIICSSDVGPDYAVQTVADLANELQDLDEEVGAVVMDFDMNINFIKMMKAVFHLRNPDCLFVVGGIDVRVPVQNGLSILGPGCFISAVEELSGRKAVVTGKPSVLVKEFINKIHPIKPERTIVIGDMMSTDMQLGTNCGFQKLLVLSGGTKFEDLKEDNTNLPHYYLKTLGDLLPHLPGI